MSEDPFPIVTVQPEWVLEPEGMGSKEKFWYRESPEHNLWLYKYPQANTGQHWAEKIVAAIAAELGILHAPVELADFDGLQGSVTESFARDGRSLFNGNQIMAGLLFGYNPAVKFRQSDHTFENIVLAIQKLFPDADASRRAKQQFAEYLVLDALVGNTDRHHENWGILRRRRGDGWFGWLAPTFDHASSLGRELRDDSDRICRRMILDQSRIGKYAEKGRGAIYWQSTDKRGISPLELVRRGASERPEMFEPGLMKIEKLSRESFEYTVGRVPDDWMSVTARQFAVEMMCYTMQQLRAI